MLGKHKSQNGTRTGLTLLVSVVVLSLLLTACGGAKPKTYTIGVVSESIPLEVVVNGFKAGMTELGYVEGKNVTYIYHGAVGPDSQKNDAEFKSLMGQKVDLLLALGTMPPVAAKKAVEGTGTPVVFAPVRNPVEAGIVASIRHPGGNVTGIQTINTTPKALEWLLKVAPGTKQVHVPYNPADPAVLTTIQSLSDAAPKLGVELVAHEVSSGEEELAAIRALPKDSAILFIVSQSLTPSLKDASQLAAELRIPTGADRISATGDTVLFRLQTDLPRAGKQAAGLADKIFKGTKPGDLPVETAESSLSINLKTAQAIGLNVPDEILRQVDNVIR